MEQPLSGRPHTKIRMLKSLRFWKHTVDAAPPHDTEKYAARIRSAMFCAIDRHCDTAQWLLELRICSAEDIATLWHLRPDLMHVIAVFRGEAIAREALDGLSALFDVVWPVKRSDPGFPVGNQWQSCSVTVL
jgi:hypothetical protein